MYGLPSEKVCTAGKAGAKEHASLSGTVDQHIKCQDIKSNEQERKKEAAEEGRPIERAQFFDSGSHDVVFTIVGYR